MPVIIQNDPTWGFLTFGDTDGTLGDRARAGTQVIHDLDASISTNRVSTEVGDARLLTGRAVGAADDLVIANRQNAHIFGDAFDMTDRARGGGDFISARGEFTADAYGDALHMSGRAVGGNDDITVAVDPVLGVALTGYGDARTLSDRARGGDDQLIATSAGTARAVLYGDGEILSDRARGGDDILHGHTANAAFGLEGSDLYGDGRVLSDRARGGDDLLVSGQGADDNLWGDAAVLSGRARGGSDVFEFAAQNGNDVIHDFRHGEDHIELHQTAFHSFGDLSGHISQTGQGVLIQLDAENSILVAGVGGLSSGDFLFT
jgi:hypothetical protein